MHKKDTMRCLGIICCLMAVVISIGCSTFAGKQSQVLNEVSTNTSGILNQEGGENLSPVDLKWYYVGSEVDEGNPIFDKVNKMIKSKINATVDFRPIGWGAYDQKMRAIIAASDSFDLCFTSNWLNNYYQNVEKGNFINLDSLIDTYAPKMKKLIPSYIWDGSRINKKLYAMINYQITARIEGFQLRKDLVDKYNFNINSITTYKDMEPFFKLIKENESNICPANIKYDGMWQFVFKSYGYDRIMGSGPLYVKYNDSDLKIVNIYSTKEYKEMLSVMRDWYSKGYLRDDILNNYDTGTDQRLGKYASWNTGTLKPGNEAEAKLSYNYDVMDTPFSEALLTTEGVVSSLTAVSKTSKNPERAVMLMELINSDKDLYATLCYGVEHVNWDKIPENSNKIQVTLDNQYWVPDWVIGSIFNSYIISYKNDNVLSETKRINETAKRSVALGFSFNINPVKSQYEACSSIIKSMTPALELGVFDNWEEQYSLFLKKLAKAGVQKVVDEAQRQMNEWEKAGK